MTKSDECEWVASFHGGEGDKRLLAIINDTPFVFVVSDGQGYLINAESQELIKFTSIDTIRELTSNADSSLRLFADTWNIFTDDKSFEVKELEVPFEFNFV